MTTDTLEQTTELKDISLNPTLEQQLIDMFAERLFRRHPDNPEVMYETMMALKASGYLLNAPVAPVTVTTPSREYAKQPVAPHYVVAQAA